MDAADVRRYWDANAVAWTTLARAGYDVYRDHLNTPAFFAILPDVTGRRGLDLGCGEGHNTRLLADAGARITGIDISGRFLAFAREHEAREPRGVRYVHASGTALPFGDARFDFVTGFVSLQDMPDPARALAEAFRVLRPGGFLQFSIEHPCFATPHRRKLRGADGRTYAVEVGGYFDHPDCTIDEWIFSAAPPAVRDGLPPFRIPKFQRTISEWLGMLTGAGFVFEQMAEPRPSDEVVRAVPKLQDAQVVAYFLHLRGRKP